jgi:hypothetical protein
MQGWYSRPSCRPHCQSGSAPRGVASEALPVTLGLSVCLSGGFAKTWICLSDLMAQPVCLPVCTERSAAELLLAAGVSASAKNARGWTSLDMALALRDVDLVRWTLPAPLAEPLPQDRAPASAAADPARFLTTRLPASECRFFFFFLIPRPRVAAQS